MNIANIVWPIIISSVAGLSTVLGSLIVFFKIKSQKITKFITFCLAFSLSIMIGISVLELIPESTYIILSYYGIITGIFICLIIFIIGSLLINFFNKKIYQTKSKKGSLYKIGILSMLVLMLHNFPEGVATFMSAYKDLSLGISLSIAIMLHNIPEGISIAVPIYYATGNKRLAIKHTFISGLAEPFGAIIAYIFLSRFITDAFISIILIFVAGIMTTLAIHELLPQALSYKEQRHLVLGLILGITVATINHFLF